MDDIGLLWQLQEIEQELEKITNFQKKNSLANTADKLKEELEQLESSVLPENEKILGNTKKIKDAELDLQSLVSERKEIEEKLYSGKITQTKELELWQGKLNNIQSAILHKEEKIVSLMEELEAKEKMVAEEVEILAAKQSEWEGHQEKSKALEEKIRKRVAFLQRKKKKIAAELTQNILGKYENLKKKVGLGAIAKLKGDVCLGCRMALPIGIIQTISTKSGLHTCENCGRILYVSQTAE